MKNIFIILTTILLSNVIYAQHPKGLLELIDESDYIISGEILRIDTLEPERINHYDLERNSAVIKIDKTVKGKIETDITKLHYYTTGGSHVFPAKPTVNEKYLFFLNYNVEKEAYTLPSKRFSLIDITQTNQEKSISLVSNILLRSEISMCEYFDLLIQNIEEPIFPINVDLYEFAINYDSLDVEFCIDSIKKERLYEAFARTKNLDILPFLRNYKSNDVDAILLEEISNQLKEIEASNEMYCIEETTTVINCLRELSFLDSKQASIRIDELYDNVWMGEHKQFVERANELLRNYER